MILRRLRMINWRSFADVEVRFPDPEHNGAAKSTVLMMGENEVGKTSLLEAVALGLYGDKGLQLVPRSEQPRSAGQVGSGGKAIKQKDLKAQYAERMKDILRRHGDGDDRDLILTSGNCAVEMEFHDPALNGAWAIRREWLFDNGVYSPSDQHRHITITHTNQDGDVNQLHEPPTEPSRSEWLQSQINERVLPPAQAHYFLFDGEHLTEYANQDMRRQIEDGISELLGLRTLSALQSTLEALRDQAAKKYDLPTSEQMAEAEGKADEAEQADAGDRDEIRRLSEEMKEINAEISEQSTGEARLDAEKALQAAQQRHDEAGREVESRKADLKDMMRYRLPMGLVHGNVRSQAEALLIGDAKLLQWQQDSQRNDAQTKRFEQSVDEVLSVVGRNDNQNGFAKVVALESWRLMKSPKPEGVPSSLAFQCEPEVRSEAIRMLQDCNAVQKDGVLACGEALRAAKRQWQSSRQELHDADIALRKLSQDGADKEDVGKLVERYAQLKKAKDRIADDMAKRAEEMEQWRIVLKKGDGCDEKREELRLYEGCAAVFRDVSRQAVEGQKDALGDSLTQAWKSMAHYADRISEMRITDHYNVERRSSTGRVIETPMSEGARQVFTQALFYAVAEVCKSDFPFIIDTPVARLDKKQREGVLDALTRRPRGQVILLPTDAEMLDEDKSKIKGRMQAEFKLKVDNTEGGRISTRIVPVPLQDGDAP